MFALFTMIAAHIRGGVTVGRGAAESALFSFGMAEFDKIFDEIVELKSPLVGDKKLGLLSLKNFGWNLGIC